MKLVREVNFFFQVVEYKLKNDLNFLVLRNIVLLSYYLREFFSVFGFLVRSINKL